MSRLAGRMYLAFMWVSILVVLGYSISVIFS